MITKKNCYWAKCAKPIYGTDSLIRKDKDQFRPAGINSRIFCSDTCLREFLKEYVHLNKWTILEELRNEAYK
jgi:hypothetical protein